MTRYTLSLWLFNLYVGYISQYACLDKSQAGIKIAGRSINIHRYEDGTALIAESKKELKSLSMRRGDEKTSLNSAFKKLFTKRYSTFMASSPTTSWHIDEGKVETMEYFIFLGSKITMNLECSHKIKAHLLLGRKKDYEKPAQCIKKQRLALLQRSVVSKLWFFQQSGRDVILDHKKWWMPKKWAFELWCLRRFLRVPYKARRQTSQSERKSTSDPCCLSEACTEGSRWKEQMLPLQRCLTMAARSK